jgi:hypothetical protein
LSPFSITAGFKFRVNKATYDSTHFSFSFFNMCILQQKNNHGYLPGVSSFCPFSRMISPS